jgi:hypothetical protein
MLAVTVTINLVASVSSSSSSSSSGDEALPAGVRLQLLQLLILPWMPFQARQPVAQVSR